METIRAKAIRIYMEQNGLSKVEFCKLCKISPATLSKILSDCYNFNLTVLFKIGRQLDIPIAKLISDWKM